MLSLNKCILSSTLLVFALGFIASPTFADKGGNSGGKGNSQSGHSSGNKNSSGSSNASNKDGKSTAPVKFYTSDRDVIVNYFHTNPYNVKALPPGIAKNLARGKSLPPGIAKQYLPKNLQHLFIMNPDYDYLIAGNDVLMVNRATGIIADIIMNAIRY